MLEKFRGIILVGMIFCAVIGSLALFMGSVEAFFIFGVIAVMLLILYKKNFNVYVIVSDSGFMIQQNNATASSSLNEETYKQFINSLFEYRKLFAKLG